MDGGKRGPYRQYLRQDEPYKSRKLQRKIRRSNQRCKLTTRALAPATECEEETIDINHDPINNENELADSDNEFHTTLEALRDNQDHCENPVGLGNFEEDEVSSGIDYSSGDISDSCSSYKFDSDDSDGSVYDDCDKEPPCDNDTPLYEGAPLSLSSSILLILAFVLKHRLTGQCFTDLLGVIEAHCPKPNQCKSSVRKLFDFFKNIKGNLVKHIFCTYCNSYICEQREAEPIVLPDSCEICGTCLANKSNDTSFFLEAPLDNQIRKLFKGIKVVLLLNT